MALKEDSRIQLEKEMKEKTKVFEDLKKGYKVKEQSKNNV